MQKPPEVGFAPSLRVGQGDVRAMYILSIKLQPDPFKKFKVTDVLRPKS